MTGRPTSYTDTIAEIICERVLTRSLHAVSKDEDLPDEKTIYNWLRDQPTFFQNYARAREIRAYRRAESVDGVIDDCRKGVIDPATARVQLDAIKWQTGKENPKAFGERIEHELSGSVNQQTDAQLEARISLLLAKTQETVDGDAGNER